jgi:hypothetical protein
MRALSILPRPRLPTTICPRFASAMDEHARTEFSMLRDRLAGSSEAGTTSQTTCTHDPRVGG